MKGIHHLSMKVFGCKIIPYWKTLYLSYTHYIVIFMILINFSSLFPTIVTLWGQYFEIKFEKNFIELKFAFISFQFASISLKIFFF